MAQDQFKKGGVIVQSAGTSLTDTGAGFIIGSEKDSLYILTAKHVIKSNPVTLLFVDQQAYDFVGFRIVRSIEKN